MRKTFTLCMLLFMVGATQAQYTLPEDSKSSEILIEDDYYSPNSDDGFAQNNRALTYHDRQLLWAENEQLAGIVLAIAGYIIYREGLENKKFQIRTLGTVLLGVSTVFHIESIRLKKKVRKDY